MQASNELISLSNSHLLARAIVDTTQWTKPRNVETLSEFMKVYAPRLNNLSIMPESNGSPYMLVITGAGLRAADITRYALFITTAECV